MAQGSARGTLRTWLVAAIAALGVLSIPAAAQAAGPTAIGVDDAGTSYVGFPSGAVKRYGVGAARTSAPGRPRSPTPTASSARSWRSTSSPRVRPRTAATSGSSTPTAACRSSLAPAPSSAASASTRCDPSNSPEPGGRGRARRDGRLDLRRPSLRGADLPLLAGRAARRRDERRHARRHADRLRAARDRRAGRGGHRAAADQRPLRHPAAELGRPPVRPHHARPRWATLLVATRGRYDDVFIDAAGVLFQLEQNPDPATATGSTSTTPTGIEVRNIGGSGTDLGKLADARAFDVFPQSGVAPGNVFVADTGNERIQRMTDDGFTFWAAAASDPGPPAAPPADPPPTGGGGRVPPAGRPCPPAGRPAAPGLRGRPAWRSTTAPGTRTRPTSTSPCASRPGPPRSRSPNTGVREQGHPRARRLARIRVDARPRGLRPDAANRLRPFPGLRQRRHLYGRDHPRPQGAARGRGDGVAQGGQGKGKKRRWVLRVRRRRRDLGTRRAAVRTRRRTALPHQHRSRAGVRVKTPKRARYVRISDVAGNVSSPIAVTTRRR